MRVRSGASRLSRPRPSNRCPPSGATGQLPGLILTWLPGKGAASQKVFFGTDEAAVAAGACLGGQGHRARDEVQHRRPPRLDDLLLARRHRERPTACEQGDVWSFSTADAGPANKIVYEVWLNVARHRGHRSDQQRHGIRAARTPSSTSTRWKVAVDWADNYGQRFWGWLKPPQTGDYTFWIAGDDAQQLWLSTDANPANVGSDRQRRWLHGRTRTWTHRGRPEVRRDHPDEAGRSTSSWPSARKAAAATARRSPGSGPGPIGAGPVVITSDYVDMFALAPLQAFGADPANGTG